MKQAYTAQGLSLIRSRPQSSLYHLAVHAPKIVAEGSLVAAPTTYPGNSLSMTGALNGFGYNLTNIKRGMTLWVGNEGARYDTGTLRVRKDYVGASLIEVAEFGSGLVNFQTGNSLTVVEDYRIWPIHPSYDSATSRWRVDLDPYTAQTKSYGPQVIMGPPAVGIMDNGKMLASYVGDLSLQHSGSITSQTWTFPDGQTVTSALGSSKNPIVITYVNASPLGGVTTLKVTDSNGNSHIGQRLTFCFGTSGRYQPMDCKFDQITGGYKQGGYRTRVSVGELATSVVVPDGAKVIIFEQASYGTAGSSVGGNYFGRDNIILVGRVVSESQRIEPFTDELTFEIETEDGELRRSSSYDMFLESGAAASDWSMASGLTLDRAGITLAKYRSTIANVVDFHPASGFAATGEIPYRDLAAGTLYDQMTYNYQAAGFGFFSFDMQGNLWAILDSQVTGLSSVLPTIMDIGTDDRRDQVQIDHEHRDTNAQYLIYAIQGGTAEPLGAWSPGDRAGYFGQRQEVSRNLAVPNQDTLITWTGNKRAQDNNPYKRVVIPLVGNNRIDPVPQSLITMSLSATDNPRGFTWNNKNLIPYEVTITYNPEHRYVSTELVAETVVNGIGGSAFTYPTGASGITPPPPPPNPTCPPGQHWDATSQTCIDNTTGIGDGNTVFVCTSAKLGRTHNAQAVLSGGTVHWTDLTTITPDGTIVGFCLYSFDPVNYGFVVTTTTVYLLSNLNTDAPTWSALFTTASLSIDYGGDPLVIDSFDCINSPISGSDDLFWLGATGHNAHISRIGIVARCGFNISHLTGTVTNRCVIGGISGVGSSGPVVRRLVSLFSDGSNHVYAYSKYGDPGGGAAFYALVTNSDPLSGLEVDYGFTFGAGELGFDGDAAYPDDGLTMYYVDEGWSIWRSIDQGHGWSEVDTESASGAAKPATHYGRLIVNIATQNESDVLICLPPGDLETNTHFYRSIDRGLTWNLIQTFNASNNPGGMACGRWPYDPNIVYFLGNSIYYSNDMLATIHDMIGDWVSVLGAFPNTPVNIIPEWLVV